MNVMGLNFQYTHIHNNRGRTQNVVINTWQIQNDIVTMQHSRGVSEEDERYECRILYVTHENGIR
jgi:hypothetical protein